MGPGCHQPWGWGLGILKSETLQLTLHFPFFSCESPSVRSSSLSRPHGMGLLRSVTMGCKELLNTIVDRISVCNFLLGPLPPQSSRISSLNPVP